MIQATLKTEEKKPKVDAMLKYAMDIAVDAAGVTVTYCLDEDKFYEYKNGVWQYINDYDILFNACTTLHKINSHTISAKKQILENLKVIKNIQLNKFNTLPLINLENGMFDPVTVTIAPHEEKQYSTMRIPYRYEPDSKCELWLKTLEEILEGDQDRISILQEFFGYCLTKETKHHKALLLLGESRCLGGETLIYDPVKNISLPVSEIKEDFHVESWDGNKIVIAKAEKPFTKEIDNLYEVSLSNGNSFVCSMSHLILTSKGYLPLRELHKGCEVFLPQTISDTCLLTHKQDDLHYSKIIQDCKYDYHSSVRSYDEQPLMGLSICQDASPSQVGVLEHTFCEVSLREDVQANKQEYNRLGQSILHPSTWDDLFPLISLFYKLNHIFYITCESISYLRLIIAQFLFEIFQNQSILESYSSGSYSYSNSPYNSPLLVITSIVYRRKDIKYDFTVPVYHNYICGGAVHHNSGKSTILQTLRAVIGDKNCSSVPLKYLSNPQYTPMLINKLVNIDTDVSAKAAEFEAEFKTITSGEPVSCNQKFVAAFDFNPCCKVVMAANIFPKITDHSSAFYKRLILIPCDRVFDEAEQNKNLGAQLRAELPGILNWAVYGLQRLLERGRFAELEFMKTAVEELEDTNNPSNVFFKEHVEVAMGEYIEKAELFAKYREWCELNKHYIITAAMFSNAVWKKFHKETPKDTKSPTGKRVWRNIRYVHLKMEISQTADYTE